MKTRIFCLFAFLSLVGCGRILSSKRIQPTYTSEIAQTSSAIISSVPSSAKIINENTGCKKIAFIMFENTQRQTSDIYSICPDGTNYHRLTNDNILKASPTWSPDATQIAFVSSQYGINQIFIMSADGNTITQITFDYSNSSPIWLPDGKRIAFLTTDGKGLWWWRILHLDSKEIEQLSKPSYDFFFQTSAWSPDGMHIAYMSMEEQKERNDGSSQIHLKNIDGTNDQALTHDTWANINPIWSPDGSKIAFLSERDGINNIFALYIIDSDRSTVERVTKPMFPGASTTYSWLISTTYSWSPDGKNIVIGDGNLEHIYIITLADKQMKELPGLPGDAISAFPSWQQ